MLEVTDQYKGAEMHLARRFEPETCESKRSIHALPDGYKFTRVVNNLISNAIKFTPDGSVISIRIKPKKEAVQISVSGRGSLKTMPAK